MDRDECTHFPFVANLNSIHTLHIRNCVLNHRGHYQFLSGLCRLDVVPSKGTTGPEAVFTLEASQMANQCAS